MPGQFFVLVGRLSDGIFKSRIRLSEIEYWSQLVIPDVTSVAEVTDSWSFLDLTQEA